MANTVWELVQSVDNEKVSYDHFFFRTIKVSAVCMLSSDQQAGILGIEFVFIRHQSILRT